MSTKEEMIELQLKKRDIHDPQVLDVMEQVDRMNFVPEDLKDRAYEDIPLPIGKLQTISQPYIVAYMVQALELWQDDKVLEIGTGCGYNTAVLSHLASEVYSIEIDERLAQIAKKNLSEFKIENVKIRLADGYDGWPENAPFDAIQITAAPSRIPESLKRQLKIGGKLLSPVGKKSQDLILVERRGKDEFVEKSLLKVKFVPMIRQI